MFTYYEQEAKRENDRVALSVKICFLGYCLYISKPFQSRNYKCIIYQVLGWPCFENTDGYIECDGFPCVPYFEGRSRWV